MISIRDSLGLHHGTSCRYTAGRLRHEGPQGAEREGVIFLEEEEFCFLCLVLQEDNMQERSRETLILTPSGPFVLCSTKFYINLG